MRQLPSLAAVRVFEAAARLENFTAAANELGMTQAAVSYQVKSLEERLGAPLFVRERGRARLSALGRQLQPALTQALDAIEAAFAVTRAEDEATLTVATTQTFANSWLAWRLGGFQVAHPDLAVRLTTGDRMLDLGAGEADVSIRSGLGDWPRLEAHRLMNIDFTPMAGPRFLAQVEAELGRPLQPGDLAELPLISPEDPWWDSWFAAAGVAPGERRRGGGLRLDSQANEGHAAMGGRGFALLTPVFWTNDIAEGRLVQPFATLGTRGFAYWLCYPPERRTVAKVRRFRDWLLARFDEERSR
ncbi:LysR substrate-binding domain-containing protein [Sphingomonas ginkgonis]|nr:LysR substrate-binding domain-containing protein [Sphingomonas ginkgonis]